MNDWSTSKRLMLLVTVMPVPGSFTVRTYTRPSESNPVFAEARWELTLPPLPHSLKGNLFLAQGGVANSFNGNLATWTANAICTCWHLARAYLLFPFVDTAVYQHGLKDYFHFPSTHQKDKKRKNNFIFPESFHPVACTSSCMDRHELNKKIVSVSELRKKSKKLNGWNAKNQYALI